MELFKLFGSILIEDKEANASISKTEKNAKGLGERFGSVIKTAGMIGAAVGGAALVAGGALIGMASKAGAAADRLLDLNSITGMSTDEIQRWERVTKVAGVSADSMTNASQKLTKSLDTMINTGGKGAESLQQLGLSVEEVSNMNADERMNAISQALAGVEDKTLRAKLGTDLFGGTWKEIAPIMDLGAEGMQKVKDSADIISNENLNKANNFRIKMDVMKDRVNYLAMELAIKLLPAAELFFNWIEKFMPLIMKAVDIAFTFIGKAIERLIEWLNWAKNAVFGFADSNSQTFEKIKQVIFNVINVVVNFIREKLTVLKKFWDENGQQIMQAVRNAFYFIKSTIEFVMPFVLNLIKFIWNNIKVVINAALNVIMGLLKVFSGLLTGDWRKAWEGVKQIVSGVWSGIQGIIRNGVNYVISQLNRMIRALNNIKFSVPDWVPVIGGKGWGFNIRQIPMLAKGGNIQQAGRVLVGEQGPEFLDLPKGAKVTPLDHPSAGNSSGISFERGAFEGVIIFDDYGVDRLMERVVERMQTKTGLRI